MPKPVLAVDFDDVVAGFNQAFARWHNEYYGTSVEYDDIYSYDMALTYSTDKETILHRVFEFSHHHHHRVEPLYDAIESLRVLKRKYSLVIVTSRCESIAQVTRDWKQRHAAILFDGAHYANGFTILHPERKRLKSEICVTLGAIAHIDDAVSHANEVVTGAGIPVFLPTRPWNKGAELVSGVIRVDGWVEITKQLLS